MTDAYAVMSECLIVGRHTCVDGHLERVAERIQALAERELEAADWSGPQMMMDLGSYGLRSRFSPERSRNVEIASYFGVLTPDVVIGLLKAAHLYKERVSA